MIVILDSIRKSQNLGNILRMIQATKAQVYITGGSLKHTHRKVKYQMQKWARLPTYEDVENLVDVKYEDSLEELIKEFRSKGYRIIGTSPRAEVIYTDMDYTADDFILIFGSEVGGLSRKKLDMMDINIRIPILGDLESLNLASSVAIILYEVLRQRDFKIMWNME